MLWKRKRRDEDLRLDEVEAELSAIEEQVRRLQRDRLVVQRRKSYAQQSVILLGVLLFPLAFLAMLAWDTLSVVWHSVIYGSVSSRVHDAAGEMEFRQLSPVWRIVIMVLVFMLIGFVYAMVALWYNRQLAGCDARIEEARAKKKALVDMLKKKSKYTETTRLLQQYDTTGSASQRHQGSGTVGSASRADPSHSSMLVEGSVEARSGSLQNKSTGTRSSGLNLSKDSSAREVHEVVAPMDDFITPGGMLLNRFVGLLAGDETELDASVASKMRRLETELEEERQKRQALELRLAELNQSLDVNSRDPFFSPTGLARDGNVRFPVRPFPSLSDSERSRDNTPSAAAVGTASGKDKGIPLESSGNTLLEAASGQSFPVQTTEQIDHQQKESPGVSESPVAAH